MEKIMRFRRLALLTGTTRCAAAPATGGGVHNRRQEAKTISRPRKRQWAAIISTIGLSLGAVAVSSGTAGAGVAKNDGGVYTLGAMTSVDGASVNSRATNGGANLSIHTNGLTAGNAYTLWSFSFSDPGACTNGMGDRLCGPGDDVVMNYVGGHIVGGSGHLTISGQVNVDNAANAEFHLVVANHGPKDPSLLPGQIKTPGPGVQIGFLIPDIP
jgi:hypothetical protein